MLANNINAAHVFSQTGKDRQELDANGISCATDDPISDMCVIDKPVVLDTETATLHHRSPPIFNRTLRPYALKVDKKAMQYVSPIHVVSTHNPPTCYTTHTVPAVVFSSGGFTTNLFHDMNDVLIPIFLTSYHFRTNVQFVVSDFKPHWVRKYAPVLRRLSGDREPIELSADSATHCFPAAVVGLRYHGNLFCNSTNVPSGYSTADFKSFLLAAFSVPSPSLPAGPAAAGDPLLVLISRQNSRVFLNQGDIVRAAKRVGFRVTVASPQTVSNLTRFVKVAHEADVVIGAHGAGMANLVFMRPRSVLVQVVPLGLQWPSDNYYGVPAKEMDLQYVEYTVTPEESTLSERYPKDDPIITDPYKVFLQGYEVSRAIYLDGQNLRLNVTRLEGLLVRVMQMVRGSFWDIAG